jgi:hypothetical protein
MGHWGVLDKMVTHATLIHAFTSAWQQQASSEMVTPCLKTSAHLVADLSGSLRTKLYDLSPIPARPRQTPSSKMEGAKNFRHNETLGELRSVADLLRQLFEVVCASRCTLFKIEDIPEQEVEPSRYLAPGAGRPFGITRHFPDAPERLGSEFMRELKTFIRSNLLLGNRPGLHSNHCNI